MATGRYCVERLRSYDPKTSTFTWVRTNICSNDLETLKNNFLSQDTRIFDKIANKEVAVRIDITKW